MRPLQQSGALPVHLEPVSICVGVGNAVGASVGALEGENVGVAVGKREGGGEGENVGVVVGGAVGDNVTDILLPPPPPPQASHKLGQLN